MSSGSLIELVDATLDYPKPLGVTLKGAVQRYNEQKFSIKPLSLSLNDGDRYGLIGRNGAGKTTLLRLMAGIYPPTSGAVRHHCFTKTIIDGNLGFDQFLSARDNIKLKCRLDGISDKVSISRIVRDVESFVDLGEAFDLPIYTYSVGMFFRVAFAYATTNTPGVLIIDEIIAAGDIAFAEKSSARLNSFLSSSNSLVMSSHSIEMLKKYCNKGLLVEKGRVTQYDDIVECYQVYEDTAL